MRVLLIQSAVFAVIFFPAALIVRRGHPLRVLVVTLIATTIYTALTATFRAVGRKK